MEIKSDNYKDIFNRIYQEYIFLDYQGKNKQALWEELKKIEFNDSKELEDNIRLFFDNKIKSFLDSSSKRNALLNNYLTYLKNISNTQDALDILDKLYLFMSRYHYFPSKSVLNNLLTYSEKFMILVGFIIKEKNTINKSNPLIKMILDLYNDQLSLSNYNKAQEKSYESYIHQIIRIPLLTYEEEKVLFNRYKKGDLTARDKIIEGNLRLVISVANRYIGCGIPFEDLIQEGNMGLVVAINQYVDNRNCRFSTYAYYWIKKYIVKAVENRSKMIRIPEYLFQKMVKFRKAKSSLEIQLGRSVSLEEIAKYLKISLKEAKTLYEVQYNPRSINETSDDDTELGDFIPDNGETPLDIVMRHDLENNIQKLLKDSMLSEREIDILNYRYGLNNHKVYTLEEIGHKYGITKERTRQIEYRALEKIRKKKEFIYYVDYIGDKEKVLKK